MNPLVLTHPVMWAQSWCVYHFVRFCTKNLVGIESFIWYGFSSFSGLAGLSPLQLTKNNETVGEHDSATILDLQEFGPSKLRIVKIVKIPVFVVKW